MIGKSLLTSLKVVAADLIRAERGNVAAIFAISLVPMLGIVGAAIDYSRAAAARSAMQAALDTTALMVSKDAQADPTMTSTQATEAAKKYFAALYKEGGVNGITIEATYTANTGSGSSVEINASGSIATDFMKIAGFEQMDIGSHSKTKWGNVRMRVAMALDNTGSMSSDGKMPALKSAAKDLIDQLSPLAKTTGDIYISIIPFAKDVNVGSGNYGKPWIKWSGQSDTWDEKNGSCSAGSSYKTKSACEAKSTCSLSGSSYNTQNKCTAGGTCSNSAYSSQNTCTAAGTCSNPAYTDQDSCTGAMVCSNSAYTTERQCTRNNGTWRSAGYTWRPANNTWTPGVWGPATWTPKDHTAWNGCVMDRDQDYDTLNTTPTASDSKTLFPADQWSSCPVELIPLSYDWAALKSKIDDMTPSGNTNQSIGLAWAWQSLGSDGPLYAPDKEDGYTYKDVIILLSDGDNTENRFSKSVSVIDARQKIMCDNAKAAGVTIYTVQVNTGGDKMSNVLQYCASSPNNFYLVTKASQTATVFNSIGISLTQLQIAE